MTSFPTALVARYSSWSCPSVHLDFEPVAFDIDFCMCMGNGHSLPGIESQGHGLELGIVRIVVSLTSVLDRGPSVI